MNTIKYHQRVYLILSESELMRDYQCNLLVSIDFFAFCIDKTGAVNAFPIDLLLESGPHSRDSSGKQSWQGRYFRLR